MSSDEYSSSGDEKDNNSNEELLLAISQSHQTTMQYLYISSAKKQITNHEKNIITNLERKRKNSYCYYNPFE